MNEKLVSPTGTLRYVDGPSEKSHRNRRKTKINISKPLTRTVERCTTKWADVQTDVHGQELADSCKGLIDAENLHGLNHAQDHGTLEGLPCWSLLRSLHSYSGNLCQDLNTQTPNM